MTKRYTHEDLRAWGASLDREQPQGLGETLLCYADDWRAEVERLRAAVAAEREACAKVCEELREDWLRGRGRYDEFKGDSAGECAEAIRARGKE